MEVAQISEAFLYKPNNVSLEMLELSKHWPRGVYYIGQEHGLFRYADGECTLSVNLPTWVNSGSSICLNREQLLIAGRLKTVGTGVTHAHELWLPGHMLIDKALSSDKANGHWFEADPLHCKRDALSSNRKVDATLLLRTERYMKLYRVL